jgi:hypothetical protein
MTCIVGLRYRSTIYLGGDAAAIGEWDIDTRPDPKVFQVGPFLVGFCGSFRMGQLLQYHMPAGAAARDVGGIEAVVTRFVPSIRQLFVDHGFSHKPDDGEEQGGTFLVAYGGELYTIYDDFQVARSSLPFTAIGAGDAYALGSLHATAHVGGISALERITLALDAATRFCAAVRPPYTILSARHTPVANQSGKSRE